MKQMHRAGDMVSSDFLFRKMNHIRFLLKRLQPMNQSSTRVSSSSVTLLHYAVLNTEYDLKNIAFAVSFDAPDTVSS